MLSSHPKSSVPSTMSIKVEQYLVEWDATNVYLTFTDKRGNGERLTFERDEMENISDAIRIALIDMHEY